MSNNCLICGAEQSKIRIGDGLTHHVQCNICGSYQMSLFDTGLLNGKIELLYRYAVQGRIREANERGEEPVLTSQNIANYLAEPRDGIRDKLDRILLYVVQHSKHAADLVCLNPQRDYPIAFAKNADEFKYMLEMLKEDRKYLKFGVQPNGDYHCFLSEEGLKRVDEIRSNIHTSSESTAIAKVLNLCEHKLRKVVRTKPELEKEVQDAFESLLAGADLDYSRETDSIEYSSKTYTPDFTMPKFDLAIEFKFCGDQKREKKIIAEINDDILPYQTKYGNLLFVVYDLGFIRDVERFIHSFEKHQNVIVRVVKH